MWTRNNRRGPPSVAPTRSPLMMRQPRCLRRKFRPAVELLEERVVLSTVSDAAYALLNELATANEANFFVYEDADSGFNHGFPSGVFAGPTTGPHALSPQRLTELIDGIDIDLACVNDPSSADGCTSDPSRLDRDRGNVMRITLPPLNSIAPLVHEFVGLTFEEPEGFGSLGAGRGYDLRGAGRVLFQARSPTPGGIDVQFGVGGRVTDRNGFFHLRDTFSDISINLDALRNPDTNQPSPPDLSNVHLLFTVVTDAAHAPNGGTVIVDNIRFDPVPTNPTGETRLSFPLGNETFGVVPAVIHAVDDGDAGFTVTGNWVQETGHAASYENDRHTIFDGGDGSGVATWTFPDLEPRVYEVQATWSAAPTNATNAPFTLLDSSQVRSTTQVDQTQPPQGGRFDGRAWHLLGLARVESGTLQVELSNAGVDNTVIADGVRITPVIPPDQAIRNLTTVYESSLTVLALLDRGTPEDLANARRVADTFLYALAHDSTGGGAQLPTAPDGSRGLRDAYSSGDIALFNDQGPGVDDAKAGQVRLVGFSSDMRLCGPSGFCLVLDGAFGGNNAFAIMALVAAYRKFGDIAYLDAAREIGNWIVGNLTDPNGPAFDPDPSVETFGGYFLGYPDQGVPKDRVDDLIRGKSIENNADIFAAFSMLAAAEVDLDHFTAAAEWTARANIAGDLVMALFDPGDPMNPRDGRFYTGTLPDGPNGPPRGPGLEPDGPRKGNDVANIAVLLDSNTFIPLALARSPRYRDQIDWREPVRFVIDTFDQQITATAGGRQIDFRGFSIVPAPTTSQFRPGGPVGGLPDGIAWEFTAQAVVTMRVVDALYRVSEFENDAASYLQQIQVAQSSAPFGDGRGIVASTLDGEDDGSVGYPPLDQCLGTPFQCVAERVGLAATTWAIFADQTVNIFDDGSSANQRFVNQTYLDLLLRPADPAGLAFWSRLLNSQRVSRGQVAQQIAGSIEHRTRQVESAYQALLNRPADPSGLEFWVGFLMGGGTVDHLKAALIGSSEYFQNRGGGTDDGFLASVYRDVLRRSIDTSGQAFFRQQLDDGVSRNSVALTVLQSVEADRLLVQDAYLDLLARPADPSGLDFHVNALHRGVRDELIIAAIVASDEYFSRL